MPEQLLKAISIRSKRPGMVKRGIRLLTSMVRLRVTAMRGAMTASDIDISKSSTFEMTCAIACGMYVAPGAPRSSTSRSAAQWSPT